MSERYEQLLAEWRACASETRDAQARVREQFDAFLDGRGPEPSVRELKQLDQLREVENAKLEAAMRYLRETGQVRRE
jgi:hypothetical protein